MFEIGDKIIYGENGVCTVEKIDALPMAGSSRDKVYYHLSPFVGTGIYFAPVDSNVFMRPVMSREEAEERTDEVLKKLGLTELKRRHNHRISGGEKRMAAIATILAMDPDTMLMDEPTSALDPYNRRVVINSIKSLSNTKLIASHDLDMILDTCSRVILLGGGRIAADGPASEILQNRTLLESNRLELPLRYQR